MKTSLSFNQDQIDIEMKEKTSSSVSFTLGGKAYSFELVETMDGSVVLRDQNGQQRKIQVISDGGNYMLSGMGHDAEITSAQRRATKGVKAAGSLVSPMPSKVFKLLVKVGDSVKAGQTLLILEAMKMEHPIKADKDGKVKKLFFKEGELLQGGQLLAEIE